jgi:hypothetical protein
MHGEPIYQKNLKYGILLVALELLGNIFCVSKTFQNHSQQKPPALRSRSAEARPCKYDRQAKCSVVTIKLIPKSPPPVPLVHELPKTL